jgi:hypothetical protein
MRRLAHGRNFCFAMAARHEMVFRAALAYSSP